MDEASGGDWGKLQSVTYVPGFWSVKGLNSTVLTSMLKTVSFLLGLLVMGLQGWIRREWVGRVVVRYGKKRSNRRQAQSGSLF